MSIGQRITELRKLHGFSQNQLAKAMEVSRQAVSKWENDQTAPVLDTDIEYLSAGRRNFARRPPVVINSVETVEKIIEKPVIQVVETVVEKIVEKPIVEYIEKPVTKKIYRKIYVRNPIEFIFCAAVFLVIGILIGLIF